MKEEKIIKEEKITEKEEKTVSKKIKKGLGKKIFNIIFWVAVAILAVIWITDFMRIRDDKDPQFCLSKTVHEFEDGTVTECTGLGYKTYRYNRTSMSNGIEFGPFFMSMREK